jgi:hypothetical protein
VKPIDAEAIRARSQAWDAGRRSLRLDMIVTLLIFFTVPSIYLFESFVPLIVGGPLIVLAAIFGNIRALAVGGELDKGYENVGLAMAPLGFEGAQLDPLEETQGRGWSRGHSRLSQGRRTNRLACDLWLAERLAAAT